ncbi:hypothetical protein L3Q82_016260, partial [Scortum barcoo]
FRWIKNGEAFGPVMKESGTLQANEEDPLEMYEGYYRCYASNILGTAMTQTIRVIVESQPVLPKQQKIRKRAYEGESIILGCNPPESSTPPHIHWMDERMVHIKQSDRVMVGLDGNLYFSNLLKSDSRDDYICNAQYSAARTILPETAVSLTVLHSNDVIHGKKPLLFRPTGVQTSMLALRHHSITLECIPEGLPTPKVEWKKKDGHLDETSGHLESHNRWLRFESITLEDDGEYECRAVNIHGSTTHSFTVTVEASPYWVKEPQNLLYSPGETVRLDCQAEGIPTPTITWSINGQPIAEVDEDPRRSVSEGVLILRDVKFSDTAVYQCEATNKHGSILLNTYLYVIKLPPQILTSDGIVYRVTEGVSVNLDCEIFGSLSRPHVTWEGEDKFPLLSDSRVSLLTNGTIRLSDINHDDSGAYTCYVKHTNISITAYLEVFNQTAILTGPQNVRTLRGGRALLDCDFYRDPRLIKYQIIWKKDGQKLMESSPDDKYTVFENGTLKVTDVQSDDNGLYSCEVITALDSITASGSITVVGVCHCVYVMSRPDPPKDLSLSDIEDHSLTLSWIPGHSHNSPITGFIVEAREEQHMEEDRWRWENWKTVPGDFNHLQLTLRPFCTYRFRVIAVNEIGNSNPSEPSDHHSTPPAIPDKNPENVRSDSTDPKTLIITWDEMEKHLHNGQGFMYKVSWREAGATDARWNSADVQSPPFFVNNTGTYAPFEIKVQAVNNALGAGPPPDANIGHSGEDEPEEPPTGITITVTNTSAIVRWNEAQNVRGQLLGYKIYIKHLGPQRARRSLGKRHHEEEKGERSERGRETEREVVVLGKKTLEEVTGLQLYSHYELYMVAFNRKGDSPPSPAHPFNTPEGAPGPPASLMFESPSEKSLILYWTPPLEPNGKLLGYMVQYQQEVESRDSPWQVVIISDSSVNHHELDSLDPNSHYIFKVRARTAPGEGPPITRRGATLLEGVPPSNVTIVSSNTSLNLSWVPGERDRNHGFHILYLRKSRKKRGRRCSVGGVGGGGELHAGFLFADGPPTGHPVQYHLVIKHGNVTQWDAVTSTKGPVPSVLPGGFAAQGWLIGLISAIVLLVLILLILCLIKRSKGGKYAVKDKEEKEVDSEARPMKDETFGEYSDADEKRSDSQPSLCGESKLGSDDSLAEYGDSVDIQFNEDGSFIGQYSGRGPVPHGNERAPAPPPP